MSEAQVEEGPPLLADVWIQVLLIFTIVAGLFCVNFFMDSAGFRVSGKSSGDNPPPPAAGGGTRHWIVDANGGAGSNYPSLSAAVSAAGDGDVLSIKPGTYRESLVLSRSITLEGAGGSAGDVVIAGGDSRTIAVSGGRVTLSHLTIVNSGRGEAAAVAGGSLSLMDVRLRSSGIGARVVDADLEIGDSRIEGRTGLSAEGKSRVHALRVKIDGEAAALAAEGLGVELKLESSELRAQSGPAVDAGRFAKIRVEDSSLFHSGQGAVRAVSGAEVTVAGSSISDNRGCAVTIDRGIVLLERDQVRRADCGIGFLGPGSLRVVDSNFSEINGPALRLKRGFEKDTILSGSGNTGIDLAAPSR